MKVRRIVAIGDLHLEGRLSAFIEDHDAFVINEVRLVIQSAARSGYNIVALLGDLWQGYTASTQAYEKLIALFREFPDLLFLVYGGNHDVDTQAEEFTHSLSLLSAMTELDMLPNVACAIREPLDLWENSPNPVRLLPWPLTDTRPDALNFIHLETLGSVTDSGRPSPASFDPDDLCVSGHLHTKQRTRNTYFPGTLYQTTFGEKQEKFYLLIDWTGKRKTSTFTFVPHSPAYVLHNRVVDSIEAYEALCEEVSSAPEGHLYKVFVNSKSVLLPVNAFGKLPQVVRTNPYSTKQELKALVKDELSLDDASPLSEVDLNSFFNDWMQSNDVLPHVQDKAVALLNTLIEKSHGAIDSHS